jgi:alanyl-tRNA synthetase
MKGSEVRKAFLDYFKSKGHEVVGSSCLVPENDPTLLFSNAGMNQFKDLFLGSEKRSYVRATTAQKCMRISGKHNDFENVGMTARHHTFFEMLGNFSFGDYFKKDAISYAWEFVTEVLKLDKSKLWVTIYSDDDQAHKLWQDVAGVQADRIIRLGEESNFWSMGDTGPCGPCSEIFYYLGNKPENQSREEFLKDDGTYMEIWNLVFMQFNRFADGRMEPLPKPSVDTGMGLERVAGVMQGKTSNYDSDLVRPVISTCEKLSGFKYDGSSYEIKDLRADLNYARDVAMRVVADHSRSIAFLIADGATPGSDGRGYVLRRLIRRAVRHGRVLNFKEPFLKSTCKTVIDIFSGQYPELKEQAEKVLYITDLEENKFYETLDTGLQVLNKAVQNVKKGGLFPGETAFLLHDTYGFPLDLTQDALKAFNLKVDEEAFNKAMNEQKTRSREDRKSRDISFVSTSIDIEPTEFLGYEKNEADTKLREVIFDNESQSIAKVGDEVTLFFNATPFYAESGGQVGDTGKIMIDGAELEVLDTQKLKNQFFAHICKVSKGEVSKKQIGTSAKLAINHERRELIKINHSATHLVHYALRKVLGDHVKQAGSRVDERSSRFDYSQFEALTEKQLSDIQDLINEEIWQRNSVVTKVLPIEEARKTGAVALFGEKYGDTVRVVQIGKNSIEFCGGTHVTNSADISSVFIQSEGGIASGVHRIECVCGPRAYYQAKELQNEKNQILEILKGDGQGLVTRVEKLTTRIKELEKELERSKQLIANAQSGGLAQSVRTSPSGIKVIAERVDDGADTDTLRSMVDRLKTQIGSGVVALGCNQGESAIIIAGVTSDLTKTLDAGALVKEIAVSSGGKGGGRKDFAQAGGVKPELLGAALNRFFELVN